MNNSFMGFIGRFQLDNKEYDKVRKFCNPVTNFGPPRPGDWPGLGRKWYWLKNVWKWATERLWDELIFFYQRGRYGYSIRDWWSIDHYLMEWLPEAIRKYKYSYGWPGQIAIGLDENESDEVGIATWHDILEQIASGLEAGKALLNFDNYNDFYENTPEEVENLRDIKFKGKKLSNGNTRMLCDEEVGLRFKEDAWNRVQKERQEKFDRAMDLLAKYFFALWD